MWGGDNPRDSFFSGGFNVSWCLENLLENCIAVLLPGKRLQRVNIRMDRSYFLHNPLQKPLSNLVITWHKLLFSDNTFFIFTGIIRAIHKRYYFTSSQKYNWIDGTKKDYIWSLLKSPWFVFFSSFLFLIILMLVYNFLRDLRNLLRFITMAVLVLCNLYRMRWKFRPCSAYASPE